MANPQEDFNRFMASVEGNQYEPEEEKVRMPAEFIQDFNYLTQPEPQKRIIPQNSIEDYNQYIQPEEDTPRTSRGVRYTLDDLEKDPEFQERADRFLEEVGRNEDIFEYLRDADWSLTAAMARSMEIGKWSEQAKQDYLYLKDTFDQASLGGARQTLGMVKDLTIDILTDPIELAAIAAAPFTLGASQGTKELVKLSIKQALKKKQKAELRKSLLKDAKKSALFTSIEGAAWAGPHDYFLQQADVELGMRDQVDATQSALTAALAAAMGGTLGGSIGLLTGTSPMLMHKLSQYSNEIKIKKEVDGKGKTAKEQKQRINEEDEIDNNRKDDNILPAFLKIIAETVGKPTTQLMKAGKKYDKLGDHLGLYRHDWARTIFSGESKSVEKLPFGQYLSEMRGTWWSKLEEGLVDINRTGKTKVWNTILGLKLPVIGGREINAFWVKNLDPKQSQQLLYLLETRNAPKSRSKTMPFGKYKGTTFEPDVLKASKKVGLLLDEIREEASRRAGYKWITRDGKRLQIKDPNKIEEEFNVLLAEHAKIKSYFPHQLQAEQIRADEKGFEDMLKTFGWIDADGQTIPYAKPNTDIASSEIEEVFDFKNGVWVKGFKRRKGKEPLNVDEVAFGKDFIKEAEDMLPETATKEEIDILAMDLKAKTIKENILSLSDDPLFDAVEKNKRYASMMQRPIVKGYSKGAGRTGALKERVFSDVPIEVMYKYIDTDVYRVLNEYVTNMSLLIAREHKFGSSADIYLTRHIKPIINQLQEDGVSTDETKAIRKRLEQMYGRVAGVEIPTPFGRGKARFVMDSAKTVQTLAHLPLATVSSLTEPLILLSRVQSKDSGKAAYDIGSALVKETRKTAERFNNGIKRQFGIKHKGTKDFADEAWLEAYKVGLALEQAVYDRVEGLYGEMVDTRLQKITRGFFKTTLLTQWTAAVQLAAFTTGKRLILENTQRLATNKDLFGNTLSKGSRERFINELNGLGVDYKRAVKWYKSSLDTDGNFDMNLAKRKRGFYENDYTGGANRFAREIILIPDVTEANKPIWYSHPVGQLFAQFASYPTAFNNIVLKRFAYEISEDIKGLPQGRLPVATPKIVATTALMTGVAAFTNMARSGGRSMEKPEGQILTDAIERWGGLGPVQYGYRFWENAQYGGGPIGSVAKAGSGPLIQDILDSILYRKGLAENLASNVPFYALLNILDYDAMKALQNEGKKIDKALFKPFTRPTKPKATKKSYALYKGPSSYGQVYAKGGVVTDVPRVPEEPDERIDRMTGLPYHMQAGILGQDVEDRAAFAEGGQVGEKESEAYSLITKDIRKLAPIFKDEEPISTYTEKELKGYAKGIKEPVYRTINKNTVQQDAEDFRDAERIGVHLSTEEPETEGIALKGYVEMIRPLDLSDMDVPLEGFEFIEEVQNNKELRAKIINDSVLPPATAEEHVEDLLFHHDLKKESIKGNEELPNLDLILNIVSSHKIREVLKDIGYDSIIYEGESLEPVDEQMERIEKFAGGPFFRKASSKIIKRKKKGIVLDRNQHKLVQEEMFEDWMDPETLFVYADNETRGAMKDIPGSDAEKARGLDNTIGIRTKKIPLEKERAYYNDYHKNGQVNSPQLKKRTFQLSKDMANVIRKFRTGNYKKIVYSDELLQRADFKAAKNSMTKYIFDQKFRAMKDNIESFMKKPPDTVADMGLNTPEVIEREIASALYSPGFVPDQKTIDPFYKTPIQKSKVSAAVTDRPRGATARDYGVPEDEALKSKGHPDEIKRLEKQDPIPTDFTEFKKYIKRLEESDSQYETALAEELKLQWMEDNPELPFPDDWIPRVVKAGGGLISKFVRGRLFTDFAKENISKHTDDPIVDRLIQKIDNSEGKWTDEIDSTILRLDDRIHKLEGTTYYEQRVSNKLPLIEGMNPTDRQMLDEVLPKNMPEKNTRQYWNRLRSYYQNLSEAQKKEVRDFAKVEMEYNITGLGDDLENIELGSLTGINTKQADNLLNVIRFNELVVTEDELIQLGYKSKQGKFTGYEEGDIVYADLDADELREIGFLTDKSSFTKGPRTKQAEGGVVK